MLLFLHIRASTITNCLESLKDQSFSDYEVIIVDGNSKDISSPITPHNVIMGIKDADKTTLF